MGLKRFEKVQMWIPSKEKELLSKIAESKGLKIAEAARLLLIEKLHEVMKNE